MDIKTILFVGIMFTVGVVHANALADLADRMFSGVTQERLQECLQRVSKSIIKPDSYPSLQFLQGNDVLCGIRLRDRSVHSVFYGDRQVGCLAVYKNGECFNGKIALAIAKFDHPIYCPTSQSQLYENFIIRLCPKSSRLNWTDFNEQTRIINCSFYWDDQGRLCVRIIGINKPGIDHLLLPLPPDPMPQADDVLPLPVDTAAAFASDETDPAPTYGPQAPHDPRPGPY